MRTPHHSQFVKEIQRIGGGKYHLFDLFRDFCELAALSLVNAADRREHIWHQPATNAPAPIIKDTTGLRQADIFVEVAA